MACVNLMENILSNKTYFLSTQGMRQYCNRCSTRCTVSQICCCDISAWVSGMAEGGGGGVG